MSLLWKRIFKTMNVEKVKIDILKTDLNNVKHHNKKNIQAIKKSLIEFGQYKPLIVDQNYQILVGRGTYQAMKSLKYEFVDVLVKNIDQKQKKQLIVLDNRSSELSEINKDVVQKVFYQLNQQQLELTAYSNNQVEKIMNDLKIQQMDDQTSKINSQQLKITCPYCKTSFNLEKE